MTMANQKCLGDLADVVNGTASSTEVGPAALPLFTLGLVLFGLGLLNSTDL